MSTQKCLEQSTETLLHGDSLDNYIDSMARLYSAVHRKFQSELALKRRHRNLALGIHRLPNDILVNIFLISMTPKENTQAYFQQRHTLGLVCDLWRTTIRTTPVFWSVVSSNLLASANEESLRRSKAHTLTCIETGRFMSYAMCDCPTCKSSPHNDFWEGLRPHAHRIETIISGPSSVVLAMAVEGLRKLVELNISNGDGLSMPQKLALVPSLESPWPRLQYLQLRGFSLPWPRSVISNIISLRLFEVVHLPLDILMDVLRDSPHLSELQLHSVELDSKEDTTINPTSLTVIPFSKLLSLELKDMPADIIHCILNSIEPQSSLDRLEISHRYSSPPYLGPFNLPPWTIKSALGHLLKRDSAANRVIIRHDRNGRYIECTSFKSPGFHINVAPKGILSWISQVLDLYPTSAPRLEVEWKGSLDSDLFDIFWEARLARFDVILNTSLFNKIHSEGALQRLCQPPFSLPSLVELVIFVGSSSATLTANLLEARYGTPHSYGVAPLRKLKYYTVGNRPIDQLEVPLSSCLPECAIEWDWADCNEEYELENFFGDGFISNEDGDGDGVGDE
jgi:hypothetical protein